MATYELIQTIEVTNPSGQAEIEFTDIDQSYIDLQIQFSGRVTRARVDTALNVQFNGDTGTTNYAWSIGVGDGSTKSAVKDASDPYMVGGYVNGASATSDVFSSHVIDIADYTGDDKKIITVQSVAENNATSATQCFATGQWTSTNPITSIKLTELGGGSNFVQYTKASLFGIRKRNTSAAPKATGGIITYDATNEYWVHTFTASGTFTPTQDLTCEYLVVAGGGGGGQGWNGGAGGGGGGGLLTGSNGVTASTNYTVTVGGGGANSTNGTNSSFLVTATGGGAGGPGPDARGTDGNSGGSGGGGSHGQLAADIGYGGTPTSSQGYAGGQSNSNGGDKWSGGGGGGAGAVGQDAPGVGDGGDGGAGLASSITGSSIYYAGGGGGNGGGSPSTDGVGGIGGGGDGGANGGTNGGAGQPATGGGGGGAGGAGGSGIVIVRYAA